MKKSVFILLISILLFLPCVASFANDYRWDYVNALTGSDYAAAERIINSNINSVSAAEKSLMMQLALSFSGGETTLRVLSLLRRHNVVPRDFDLFTAIDRNQSDAVVQFILDSGARANGEILLVAMEKRRFNFARQFIQSGVDVNYQYPLARNYSDGMSPLMHAARNNDLELVQMLAERGANINARSRDGSTALSIAQANGNTQISDFLIERGANQTGANPATNQPSSGVAGFLDSRAPEFQPGSYRLRGGTRDLVFTGTSNFGNIGYIRNNRAFTGSYQTAGDVLTIIMDGNVFTYRLDSSSSFSGNGEVWNRTGN